MCIECGCAEGGTSIEGDGRAHLHRHADGSVHSHAHGHGEHGHAGAESDRQNHHGELAHSYVSPGPDHTHTHAAGTSPSRRVQIEQDILSQNNAYADANRKTWAGRGIFVVNLVSSPGSGKTTLLVRSIEMLNGRLPLAVIEGDQQTSNDAERIRAAGARAVQINTGKGCHLDAHRVGHAFEHMTVPDGALLLIENVGNLVCPAEFDLGESHKVLILSVTEGEDKPLKYPNMFAAADLMILAKVDLLPYVAFEVAKCVEYARRVNPNIEVLQLSSTSGAGMERWLAWLDRGVNAARAIARMSLAAAN